MKTLGTTDMYDVNRSIMNPAPVRRAMLVITMFFCSLPLSAAGKWSSVDRDAIATAKDARVASPSLPRAGHAQSDRITASASAIWGTWAICGTSAISRTVVFQEKSSAISKISAVSNASTPSDFMVIWGKSYSN
jgi:hypothetical protein